MEIIGIARSPVEVTKAVSIKPSDLIGNTISKGNQGKDMPFEKKVSTNPLSNAPLPTQNTLPAATDVKSKVGIQHQT